MALLVQLEAQDADSSAAPAASLFVRCTAEDSGLQLLLAEGDALWRATVTAAQKPAALACSSADFQRTLHAAFSVARDDTTTTHLFTYKWSRSSGSLTLMEPSASSSFAMKYASLSLVRVRASEHPTLFTELFQAIVTESDQAAHTATQLRARLTALESLVRAKDALLDTAVRAKQQVEDELFRGFCAVLNAKKDEIQRLQHELAVAHVQLQAAGTFRGDQEVKTTTSQKIKGPKGGPRARAKGAKLRRTVKSEDGSSGDSGSSDDAEASDGHDESTGDDNNGDLEVDNAAGGFNRASSSQQSQRDTVNAYSQLPSPMRSGSQVCTAADVLSGLDAILQDDVAATDDALRSPSRDRRSRRLRPEATGGRDTPAVKKRKSDTVPVKEEVEEVEEAVAAGNRRAKKTPTSKAAAPPVKKAPSKPTRAVDSEEEDILDMLA